MKSTINFLFIIFVSFSLIMLNGCKETGCTDPTALNYNPEAEKSSDDCTFPTLSLDMNFVVGSEDFSFGTTYMINGVATKFTIAQFYLSNVRVATNGEADVNPDTYLLVKADQPVYEVGQITAGHKHMLMYAVGIDSATNHADPTTYAADHPLAPQNPNMHWSWDNGYQFIKIEGQVDTDNDGTPDGLLEMHIGKDSNLRNIALEAHKESDTEDVMISVKVDMAKLFEGLDLATQSVTHTADEPVIAAKVIENVPNVFSIDK